MSEILHMLSVQGDINPDTGTQTSLLMGMDSTTLLNLEAFPERLADLSGHALSSYLQESGAVCNDAYDETGKLLPALTETHVATGITTAKVFMKRGVIENPVDGEPAVQFFDVASEKRTRILYCRNGVADNPAPGTPALQVICPDSGLVIDAHHFIEGEDYGPLSMEELITLNQKKREGQRVLGQMAWPGTACTRPPAP